MSKQVLFCQLLLFQSLLPLLKQAAEANSGKPLGAARAAVINMSSVLGSIAQNDQGGFYPYRCSKVLKSRIKAMVKHEFIPNLISLV